MNSLIIALAIILAVFVLFLAFLLYFNRDPARAIPSGKSIVSPADGRVMDIIDLTKLKKKKGIKVKKGFIGKIRTIVSDTTKPGWLIPIFMTPLNVHVQRAPVEGKVVSIKHSRGRFFPANTLKATVENEKNETVIENMDIGKIKVIQIAGFLTRRIICFVSNREKLLKGQRIGRINLGSQVVIIMPKLRLKIKKGDSVVAGETIIAEY